MSASAWELEGSGFDRQLRQTSAVILLGAALIGVYILCKLSKGGIVRIIFFQLLAITGAATQVPNNNNNTKVGLGPPQIHQCFYEGKWYSAGRVIDSGRSLDWCFGTYCDADGMIKHWDDFRDAGSLVPQRLPSEPRPIPTPAPTTTPIPVDHHPVDSWFSNLGCWYRGRFFWSGEDIENYRRGRRCLGKYCDWNGRIQSWSDDCRYTLPPLPTPAADFT